MPDPKQEALGDELFGTPMEAAGLPEASRGWKYKMVTKGWRWR